MEQVIPSTVEFPYVRGFEHCLENANPPMAELLWCEQGL